jgi:hypothetical protein
MDIRGRCNPTHYPLTWENCGAKIDSTFFYINNNFDEYHQYAHLCEPGVRQERNDIIASIAINKYGLELGDEVDDLLELFNKEDEDDCKYNCICCDNFVHTDEEYNCRTDGDKEGIICWDCLPEHFCEDCDEFCETKLKPNNCGKYICDDCEESRLDAFNEAEKEKADKKKKMKKEIIEAWNNIKNDMGDWVNDYTTDDKYSIDDLGNLISALNGMLNEIGIAQIDL